MSRQLSVKNIKVFFCSKPS